MSLLGRLEDLSLTDIVQIVFLSRRTGVLEIIDDAGRHTVLFLHGLVVNASAPDHPDLITYLDRKGAVPPDSIRLVRQMEDSGIPCGNTILEMNMISKENLAAAIRDRILSVVTPILHSRHGEFNFILTESMNPVDIEYEVDAVVKEGGFAPQKILSMAEGDKIKPLRGLEESLKAGKALLRRAGGEAGPAPLDLPMARSDDDAATEDAERAAEVQPPEELPPVEAPRTAAPEEARADQLPAAEPVSPPANDDAAPRPATHFKVAGGLFEVESPEAAYRNVLLFERDPLVRVAARRAFLKHNIKILQFGTLEDLRPAVTDFFRSNSFFVTFLELTADDSALRLMHQLKRRNPRLPVVMIDSEADLRRRHDLLRAGADLYVTRPPEERMQPGMAEEELALFADELVLFAERSFEQWERLTGSYGQEAGKRFYEIGEQETVDRSFTVLKQLINELNDPNDIGQLAATILRLSGEYLERGALFLVDDHDFVGLGGFGVTGGGEPMDDRVRTYRVPRSDASILAEVAGAGKAHRGKIRRTDANVRLIERMGNLLPTEVVALPVMHNDRGIGILYGDNAEHRAPIDSITGLEIFLSQAGYAFGNAVLTWQKAERGREAR